jgi:hypothetical protein
VQPRVPKLLTKKESRFFNLTSERRNQNMSGQRASEKSFNSSRFVSQGNEEEKNDDQLINQSQIEYANDH